ncbi:hypothetical protein WJ63_15950 [Burkholderia pyrrocinia]|nr:hypothetical protein WJ63_15950 [Burkholderia pyrrocinia]
MGTRTLLAALLGIAQPLYMADLAASAVDQPIAPDDHDAAAPAASDAGESNADAPVVADAPASDTSSSAAPASLSSGTAAADALHGDAPEVATSGEADAASAAADPSTAPSSGAASSTQTTPASNLGTSGDDPTPTVSIDVEDHAEARERFAGLMAKLRGIEHEAAEYVRAELRELGTLLHLHTVASGKADATGDYSSSDLS